MDGRVVSDGGKFFLSGAHVSLLMKTLKNKNLMFTLTGKHQHQTMVFPGVIKKKSVKFPGILVLGLKIKLLKGVNTTFGIF